MALRALSHCVFPLALGCSSYTDISYHNKVTGTFKQGCQPENIQLFKGEIKHYLKMFLLNLIIIINLSLPFPAMISLLVQNLYQFCFKSFNQGIDEKKSCFEMAQQRKTIPIIIIFRNT